MENTGRKIISGVFEKKREVRNLNIILSKEDYYNIIKNIVKNNG